MTERQKAGYDEAARGGPGVPASDVGLPAPSAEGEDGDGFDRAADEAARDVWRRDHSAD